MKRTTTRFSVLTLFVFMGILLVAAIGCDNNCNDVICQNNGTCEDGTCICPEGYGGDNCEQLLSCEVLEPLCPTNANCTMLNGLPVCQCNIGYEGDSCTQLTIENYIGNGGTGLFYNATDQCATGTPFLYTTRLSPASNNTEFYIESFGAFDAPPINVRCVLTGITTFNIPLQTNPTWGLSVRNWATEEGSIDTVLQKVTVPYIIKYSDNTIDSCKVVLSLQ